MGLKNKLFQVGLVGTLGLSLLAPTNSASAKDTEHNTVATPKSVSTITLDGVTLTAEEMVKAGLTYVDGVLRKDFTMATLGGSFRNYIFGMSVVNTPASDVAKLKSKNKKKTGTTYYDMKKSKEVLTFNKTDLTVINGQFINPKTGKVATYNSKTLGLPNIQIKKGLMYYKGKKMNNKMLRFIGTLYATNIQTVNGKVLYSSNLGLVIK